MRVNEVQRCALPERKITIPELGGDGVVTVRSVGFGEKIRIVTAVPPHRTACELVAGAVLDDDGLPVMSADEWDAFAAVHEDRFFELLTAAKDVTGLEVAEVKKA